MIFKPAPKYYSIVDLDLWGFLFHASSSPFGPLGGFDLLMRNSHVYIVHTCVDKTGTSVQLAI